MLGQSEPIDNLRLWLEDQDRRLLTVVCGRCNIIAIQFGRPKRCSSPRLCGYFADARVLVGARLLVDKDTAYVKSSSSRNIASLSCCIEVDAIHTLHGGQACDFPASARVHHDHAWGVCVPISSLCEDSSNAASPGLLLLTGHVATICRL